jgi:hypothetical protein
MATSRGRNGNIAERKGATRITYVVNLAERWI